jgi:hypothetical protein
MTTILETESSQQDRQKRSDRKMEQPSKFFEIMDRNIAINKKTNDAKTSNQFTSKDSRLNSFTTESLILAQDER